MKFPLVVLIVLDGWGLAPPTEGNAISQAKTPNINKYWSAFPHTTLAASGEAVGLPKAEAGNTETGHLNLGAGRIVYQDLPKINLAIANGSFFQNEAFLKAIEHARTNNSNLHLMGLLGAGGVHSSINHLYALLRLCKEQDFGRVFVHVFTDGRDSAPNSALSYISDLESFMVKEGVGKIASVMGRYWAMDRDFRWERTAKAYFALTRGEGKLVNNAQEAVNSSYEKGVTDEFMEPALVAPPVLIREGDSVIFFNYRIDRPRQLTRAFVWEDFETTAGQDWGFAPFARGPKIPNLFFVTITEYGRPLREKTHVAFPPTKVDLPLEAVLANNNLRQLRVAETEKERFVTFYFNGQNEIKFPGEEWVIVKSPAVATYDQKPEMAAQEITQAFLAKIGQTTPAEYGFALINFANADMLGHTGNKEAIILGCEVVDEMVGRIVSRVNLLGGATLITADHGNAEQTINPATLQPDTEHTTNPVPFIAISQQFLGRPHILPGGILADVAPTVLHLLGVPKPQSMTGRVLLE